MSYLDEIVKYAKSLLANDRRGIELDTTVMPSPSGGDYADPFGDVASQIAREQELASPTTPARRKKNIRQGKTDLRRVLNAEAAGDKYTREEIDVPIYEGGIDTGRKRKEVFDVFEDGSQPLYSKNSDLPPAAQRGDIVSRFRKDLGKHGLVIGTLEGKKYENRFNEMLDDISDVFSEQDRVARPGSGARRRLHGIEVGKWKLGNHGSSAIDLSSVYDDTGKKRKKIGFHKFRTTQTDKYIQSMLGLIDKGTEDKNYLLINESIPYTGATTGKNHMHISSKTEEVAEAHGFLGLRYGARRFAYLGFPAGSETADGRPNGMDKYLEIVPDSDLPLVAAVLNKSVDLRTKVVNYVRNEMPTGSKRTKVLTAIGALRLDDT